MNNPTPSNPDSEVAVAKVKNLNDVAKLGFHVKPNTEKNLIIAHSKEKEFRQARLESFQISKNHVWMTFSGVLDYVDVVQ